ncbi:hypothetical protein ANO14919_088520 [Xylariales sp. No.14919]|nr:hypothetical protein ANO14919_088520 [Xylariales sp. No.14919]
MDSRSPYHNAQHLATLQRLVYQCVSGGRNPPLQILSEAINAYMDLEPGEDAGNVSKERKSRLQDFLDDRIWFYLQSNTEEITETMLYLSRYDPQLYSSPLSNALSSIHNKIAHTSGWFLWNDYCQVVGRLVEEEVEHMDQPYEILRIMVESFERHANGKLTVTLLAGAATCINSLSKPVLQFLMSQNWNMQGHSCREITKPFVTPQDWQLWAQRLSALAENHYYTGTDIGEAARQAASLILELRVTEPCQDEG